MPTPSNKAFLILFFTVAALTRAISSSTLSKCILTFMVALWIKWTCNICGYSTFRVCVATIIYAVASLSKRQKFGQAIFISCSASSMACTMVWAFGDSINGMQSIMCVLLGLSMAQARITKNFDPLMSDSSTTMKICFSFRIALNSTVSSFANVVSFSHAEDSLGRGCPVFEKRFLKSGFLSFFRGISADRKARTTSLAKSLSLPVGKNCSIVASGVAFSLQCRAHDRWLVTKSRFSCFTTHSQRKQ